MYSALQEVSRLRAGGDRETSWRAEYMTYLALHRAERIRQRGMTLIEILVAIVVLSVGLLGLAGLQLKGLQVNQGSIYRWQAAMLAEDIADRIRADRAGAGTYTLH